MARKTNAPCEVLEGLREIVAYMQTRGWGDISTATVLRRLRIERAKRRRNPRRAGEPLTIADVVHKHPVKTRLEISYKSQIDQLFEQMKDPAPARSA